MPEHVDPHVQQIQHLEGLPIIGGAVVVGLRIGKAYLQVAGHGHRKPRVIRPSREPVGLGPVGLFGHGHSEIREECEVDGMRQKPRQGGVLPAVGHERDADAAVLEIELRGLRISLAVHPGFRIGRVLERRRAAM